MKRFVFILAFLSLFSFFQTSVSYSLTETPAQENQNFINLPTFDLEVILSKQNNQPAKEGASLGSKQVGDEIELKIASGNIQWEQIDPQFSNPSESEDWYIFIKRSSENSSQSIIVATPLKPGRLTLPSLVLKNSTGQAVAKTNPFSFDVGSAIQKDDPRPNQPEEIEPPLRLKFPLWVVILASTLGILLILLGSYSVYRFLKKNRPKKKLVSQLSQSEDEIALLHLLQLENENLIHQNKFKKYYFRLSEILKAYIDARYQVEALESTSGEVVNLLQNKNAVAPELIQELNTFFEKLDLVKFTDYVPDLNEPKTLIENIRNWIKKTRKSQTVMEMSNSTRIGRLENASQ